MLCNKGLSLILIISISFLSCVFNTEDNSLLIMKRVDNETDTVSLWPQFIFEFSVPLKDSIVTITITPDPGPSYNVYLNNKRDTLTVTITGKLKGVTRYILTLKQAITAENGNKLYPEDAVFEFITLPSEKEPNNKKENADTLLTVCFGAVKPANDTDCFFIYNTTATGVYLKSHDKKSGFIIIDNSDTVLALDDEFDDVKTIDITDFNTAPLFVNIFSLFDNDARYELGLIP